MQLLPTLKPARSGTVKRASRGECRSTSPAQRPPAHSSANTIGTPRWWAKPSPETARIPIRMALLLWRNFGRPRLPRVGMRCRAKSIPDRSTPPTLASCMPTPLRCVSGSPPMARRLEPISSTAVGAMTTLPARSLKRSPSMHCSRKTTSLVYLPPATKARLPTRWAAQPLATMESLWPR